MNFIKSTMAIILLSVQLLSAQVVINEYSAANKTNYANGGNYYDWIELYNPSASAATIGGWYLTDDKNTPTKYQIPGGVTIPANGFRIFLCSDLGTFTNGQYHTNFKLTQSDTSEEILLTNAALVRMDSVKVFPCDSNDSRGRATNGAATWSVFTKATPNASNNTQTAYANYTPKVTFSIPAGFYAGAQTVALSCLLPNVTIRYTTNGSIPTTASTTYSTPINVSTTTVIRARAFDNSGQNAPSFTETNTYFINENHSLPVVSVTANSLNTQLTNGTLSEQFGSLEFFSSGNQQVFEIGGEFTPHGNDSWAYSQKGFDFNIEDEYGTGDQTDVELFYTSPRKKFKWLIFKAGASDNFPDGGTNPPSRCAHIRDAFNQTLSEKFGLDLDVRRMDHCLVFVNGQYWGVYEYREKVDADYFSYYYNQGEKWVDDLTYWGGLNIVYGSDTAWNNLYNFVISNNMAVPANYQHVADRLDVMSLIDCIALGIYTVNSDWINWNTAWWRGRKTPNNVKWKYWLWDTDNTFNLGQNYTGWSSTNYTANPCDLSGTGGGTDYTDPSIGADQGHLVIFDRLMDNPTFKSLYINRLGSLISTAFSCNNMLNHLDTMIARIQPEMQRHCTKWGGSYTQWQQNVQYLRNQISGRCAVFAGGVDSCYSVTGPYPLAVNIYPACSGGTVTIGAVQTPDQYPYHGSYFGGVTQNLVAHAAPGWQFDHWTVVSHTLQPTTTADSVWFDLGTTGDSITAVFTQTTPVMGNLYVSIQGNNPGSVTVNGNPVSNGQTYSYALGSQLNLAAVPVAGCTFNHYSLNHGTFTPNDTTESSYFCFNQNDTLTVVFDACAATIDTNYLTVIVVQPGYGNVSINAIAVPAPITIPVPDNTTLNIAATANVGYTFSNWAMSHHSVLPNNNTATGSFTLTQTDTLYAYFVAPDTFNLTVLVAPAGGGNVSVNGNTPGAYPATLQIVAGTLVNIAATANVGYTFANWTLLHHTLNPNNTSANTNFTLTQADTLVANFTVNPLPPDTFNLTVLVAPAGGGNVSVNGNTPGTYPATFQIVDGTLVNIAATANIGYTFANWTLLHHTLNPNNTSANANFTLTQADTLVANFTVNPLPPDTFNLTVLVAPAGGGNVSVNGNTPGAYPATLQIVDGTLVNIAATANIGYTFANWTLLHHTLNPNNTSANANFIITQADTLVANFTLIPSIDSVKITVQAFPVNGGSVDVNGTAYNSYPSYFYVTTGTLLNVNALPAPGFKFNYWHVVNQTALPNDTTNPMSFTAIVADTIYVFFEPLPPIPPDSFTILVNVKPNVLAGDVKVAGFMPPGYPYLFKFEAGTQVDFEAIGNVVNGTQQTYNYVFDHYDFIYHTPIPNTVTPIVFIQVQQPDTVVAYFVNQPPSNDTTLQLWIPSAFSPDGVNTVFRAHPNSELLADFNMQIYNRWGQKVFESNNQTYGWNGEFNGKRCDLGVYTYVVWGKRMNGQEVFTKGTVTLIR